MPWAPKRRNGPKAARRPSHDRRAGFRGRKRKDAKLAVLNRDNYSCQVCGRFVTLATSHLDHRRPLSQGGSNEAGNLQTLCIKCSKAKTAGEAGRGGSRPTG